MAGWVKFHRKIEDWEWYKDANTFRVFFHLVLKANHKDGKWQGVDIKRGQTVTSPDSIAKDLKLTRQQVRTSLNKLKSTNELTIKSTNKYSLVTIENYGLYQSNEEEVTNKTPSEQQTDNQQITTNKNDKKKKEEKNIQIALDFEGYINQIRSCLPKGMTTSRSVAFEKLPKIIKQYGLDKTKNALELYVKEVMDKRRTGFDTLKFVNESTFWNSRYKDYIEEDIVQTLKPTDRLTVDDLPQDYKPFERERGMTQEDYDRGRLYAYKNGVPG